ncbi:MAG: hypothetical protein OXE40_14475, partial [Gammaproteobacteria bacterium]|nr:hypothetical protein [Gammaproteobacteria bacterium]
TALLSPAGTPPEFEWFSAYKPLRGLARRFFDIGWPHAHTQFTSADHAISKRVMQRFKQAGGKSEQLDLPVRLVTKPEQAWRVLQDMLGRAERSGDEQRIYELRATMSAIANAASKRLAALTDKYGPINSLSSMSTEDLQALQTRLAIDEPSTSTPETTAPPLSATGAGTAVTPGAVPQGSPWLQDDYAVERALIAANLPAGFDASRLISDASTFERFGIARELKAGRLPMKVIDDLLRERKASVESGSHLLDIEYLRLFKENIQSALHAAYPGRVDPEWLDQVRERLRAREEAATATSPPVTDPGSVLPGPSSQAVGIPPTRPRAVPRSSSPGPQAIKTSGIGQAFPGSPEISLAQRESIVRRFRSEDVSLSADYSLQTGGAGVLGWSATRCRQVLEEVWRLHEAVKSDPEEAASLVDVDWSALSELVHILDILPRSP